MANSVTARFNDNCKIFVSMSDDTTVDKAVIIDADGTETEIGGGGGESDFSTAKLTVVGTPVNPIYVPITAEIPMGETLHTTYPQLPSGEEGGIYDVVLYKGNAILSTTQTFTTTGDIQSISENIYLITGDCTITITIV